MLSLWEGWVKQLRHVSCEDLVALADGELSARATRKVRRHLQVCWSCRHRTERAEAAISAFMRHRSRAFEQESPGNPDWSGFASRLARASRQVAARQPATRWKGAGWASAAAAAALGVLIWFSFVSAPVASARTLLIRAREAERSLARTPGGPVLHRRLTVERRSQQTGRSERALLEFWLQESGEPGTVEGGAELWPGLASILHRAGGAFAAPLSASAFERWWAAAGETEDSVESLLLPDGSRALEVRVRRVAARAGDGIIENRLTLREELWIPVRQRLLVRVAGEIAEYDLREESHEFVSYATAFSHLAAPVRLASPKLPSPPPAGARTHGPAVSEPRAPQAPANPDVLLTAAVEAHFALHRLEACLGEPIEVERDAAGSRIVIKGLVPDDARRQQLTASLSSIEHVSIRLATVGEAVRHAAPGATGMPGHSEQVTGGVLAVERLLGPGGIGGRSLVGAANLALGASSDALLHAFALERLAASFPAEAVSRMKPASRWLLETMARAHAGEIHAQTLQVEELVTSLLGAAPPDAAGRDASPAPDSWRQAASILLERLRRADGLVKALFTASASPDLDAVQAAARLRAELRGTGRLSKSVAAQVPREFGGTGASMSGEAAAGPPGARP